MSDIERAFVWDHSPYKGTAKLIHLKMADVANDTHQHRLWIGDRSLALKAACDERTVRRVKAQMISDGYLEYIGQNGETGFKEYRFLMPRSQEAPDKMSGRLAGGPVDLAPGKRTSHPVDRTSDPARPDIHAIAPITNQIEPKTFAPTVVDASEFALLRQALAEACGTDLQRATSSEAGKVAKSTREILEAGGKATDVPRAAAAYPRVVGAERMTEPALAKHWSRLTGGSDAPAPTSRAETEGVRLANRGLSRAEARDELVDIFDDDQALVDEGLAAFDRRCDPGRRASSE